MIIKTPINTGDTEFCYYPIQAATNVCSCDRVDFRLWCLQLGRFPAVEFVADLKPQNQEAEADSVALATAKTTSSCCEVCSPDVNNPYSGSLGSEDHLND